MKVSLKTLFIQGAKLSVTVFTIYWVVRTVGYEKIIQNLRNADVVWLVYGAILFSMSIFFGALQWHGILKSKGVDLSFKKTCRIYFIGMFFNNLILGQAAGDSYKVAILHLNEQKGKAGFAATFLDRLAGLLVLSLFAIIGGGIILMIDLQQNKEIYQVLGVLSIFVSIFFGFFLLLLSKRLQELTRNILKKMSFVPGQRVLLEVLDEVFINRRGEAEKKMLLRTACISLIIQSLRMVVNIFAGVSLGLFSWGALHYFLVIIPVVSLLMIVPLPLGVRELSGSVMFNAAGFVADEAFIMLSLATLCNITGSLAGGAMFLMSSEKKILVEEEGSIS